MVVEEVRDDGGVLPVSPVLIGQDWKKELTANGIAAETSFGRRRDWVEFVEWSEVYRARQFQLVVSLLYIFHQTIEKLTSYS